MRDALGEGAERLRVAQVADVLADPRAAALGEAERALELGAAREQRGGAVERAARARPAPRRASGAGSSAGRARPAPPSRPCACGSAGRGRRIASAIGASRAAASSSRKAIGSSQTLPLVSTSGTPASREQQVVQRRVREHHAELARAGRHRGRDARVRAPRREHDRTRRRRQQPPPRPGRARRAPARRRRPRPSARTACPRGACARAAAATAPVVGRAAREVVAADALDRDDRPRPQQARGGRHGVAPRRVDRRAPPAARTRGTRSAARGSGGRAGRRTPPGMRRTSAKPAIVVCGRS